METNNLTSINVYVANRALYENGTDNGLWIDITAFYDKSEFLEDVTVKLGVLDEKGLIYIDWDENGNRFINTNFIYDSIFDMINYINENKDKEEPIMLYIERFYSKFITDFDYFIEKFNSAYEGYFDTKRDFGEYIFSQLDTGGIPSIFIQYFDVDSYTETLFITDYIFIKGYVFRRY